MVEQAAAGCEQREQPLEVHLKLREADVFEHADRADGVEGPVGHVAVVLAANFHLAAETGLGDAFGRQLRLRFRQGHPDTPGAVVAGGVQEHGAPPAANVE